MRLRALRPRRVVESAALAIGLLASSLVVWHTSSAAFTAATSDAGNSWQAGVVALTDDDGGAAMFTLSGAAGQLKPGDSASRCIVVTYGGSFTAPAAVKLYATGLSGTGLEQYLDLTVEQETTVSGTYASCGTFNGAVIYAPGTPTGSTGTLGYFTSNMDTYSHGVGTWSPTATGQTKAYRFTYTVQNNTAAQSLATTVTFVWEVRNS